MRLTKSALFVLLLASLTACQNKNAGETENPYAKKDNGPEQLNAREREFVDDVIEDNNDEMAWLNAAVRSGTDAELKAQAQHMLADHEKMNSDMKALAGKKGVEIEEVDTTATILDINEDNPADWDKEWADEMADKHRRLIRRFERAANYVNDAELKALVNRSLPMLRSHLEMANELEDRLDKPRK